MPVATDTAISIDTIEAKMDELGYETEFFGDDDATMFFIRIGDKEITIYNGVSGDYFRPEDVTVAEYFFGIMGKDLTERFAECESIHDFVYIVQDAMAVNFMAR
jgi:hypothetical protein